LAILAVVGLYVIGSRLAALQWAVSILTVLLSLGLAKMLYGGRDDFVWPDFEKLAGIVDRVTPANGLIYADEQIYFLTRRPPPSGMEMSDSHKFDFPPERSALLHVIPVAELNERVQSAALS